jgi:hypothetical protein
MSMNTNGLALDAWIAAIPEDVYDPCPCGCGEKFRYVAKDEKKLAEHENVFVRNRIIQNEVSYSTVEGSM